MACSRLIHCIIFILPLVLALFRHLSCLNLSFFHFLLHQSIQLARPCCQLCLRPGRSNCVVEHLAGAGGGIRVGGGLGLLTSEMHSGGRPHGSDAAVPSHDAVVGTVAVERSSG